jgi:hypothetical protein
MQQGTKVEKSENIPFDTNLGPMTGQQIVDHLTWCSYKAQRDYGISHERLIRFGLGNDAMDKKYNDLQKPKP